MGQRRRLDALEARARLAGFLILAPGEEQEAADDDHIAAPNPIRTQIASKMAMPSTPTRRNAIPMPANFSA